MDELLTEFLTETADSLSTLDVELARLERSGDDPKLIDNIFRLVHTIKGTCGFLGLPRLAAVAHAAENVLGRMRDGGMRASPGTLGLVLAGLDRIKDLLAALEATGQEPAGDDDDLIDKLDAVAAAGHGEASPDELERAFRSTPIDGNAPIPAGATPVEAEPEAAPASSIAGPSIRVSVELLENLMTMVGDLVLTRNQLMRMVGDDADSELTAPLQRLSQVTAALQEGVLKTRLQPIGKAWAKLPRIVRGLGHELGKKIELQLLGADTELDRQVLEMIRDPLTHMVRNAGDHGLEPPADRIAAAKPETGTIVLNAYHEGGHIIVEIKDDGRGLDTDAIRRKVLEKGLASEADLQRMPDREIQSFIFSPGFSTARAITPVSGRGVGMDVVRANVEKIGGSVDLRSMPGRGTTVTIKIPLTLAIVPVLVVECAGERLAVPQTSVAELVRVAAGSGPRIETINGAAVLRLRNRLLPLVHLDRCLRLRAADAEAAAEYVVVSQVGGHTFGIVVGDVFDTEEVVVKPMARLLRDVATFSGHAVLGDGSVIMILDPNGIVGSTSVSEMHEDEDRSAAPAGRDDRREAEPLLLFRAGDGRPKAVQLALVSRLEEIPAERIEIASDRYVAQYRGKLMPLLLLEGTRMRDSGRQPVLVFADGERTLGLAVDEIVDIVDQPLTIELGSARKGYTGCALVAGRATDLINVADLMAAGRRFGDTRGRRVLLVDDNPFFRNMLTPLLRVAGYQVTVASAPDEALKLRAAGAGFDVIVADIEMPGMNGFDFAAEVRRDGPWRTVPMLALSSDVECRDVARGREAGFDDHVGKLDRDALLQALSQALSTAGHAA